MNRFLGYVCLVFVIFSFSCRRGTVPTASGPTADPEQVSEVTVRNIDYTYFSSKGRMQLESSGNSQTVNMTLRMKKDSVIWISLSPGLGIELARAMITRDSIRVLDRINRHYYAGNFEMLRQRYHVDLDFDILQNILIGNYTPGTPGTETLVNEAPYQHSQQRRGSLVLHQYIDTTNYKMKRVEAQDDQTDNQMSVDYSDFDALGSWPFPYSVLVAVQGTKGGSPTKNVVSINHRQPSLTDPTLAFPFSVPSGFERK